MTESIYYVGAMLISGWAMGIVFDLYNTVTGASRWLKWLRPTLDFSFWLCSAAFVYHLSLVTDAGRFRLYTLGLIAIGYVTYRLILRKTVVGSAFAFIRAVQFIILSIWKTIQVLLLFPLLSLLKLIFWILRMLYLTGCRVEDAVSWVIRLVVRILLFPFSGYLQWTESFRVKIAHYQEGMWSRVSNWLRKRPNGA